jgi:hypothetical protein
MKKWIIIPAILVILAAGLYTAYWFYAAQQTEAAIKSQIASFESNIENWREGGAKVTFTHGAVRTTGFPGKARTVIESPILTQTQQGTTPHTLELQTAHVTLIRDPIDITCMELQPDARLTLSTEAEGKTNKVALDYKTPPRIIICAKPDQIPHKFSYTDTGYQVLDLASHTPLGSVAATKLAFSHQRKEGGMMDASFLLSMQEVKGNTLDRMPGMSPELKEGLTPCTSEKPSNVTFDLTYTGPDKPENAIAQSGKIRVDIRKFASDVGGVGAELHGVVEGSASALIPNGKLVLTLRQHEKLIRDIAACYNAYSVAFPKEVQRLTDTGGAEMARNVAVSTLPGLAQEDVDRAVQFVRSLADTPVTGEGNATITLTFSDTAEPRIGSKSLSEAQSLFEQMQQAAPAIESVDVQSAPPIKATP